MIAATRVRLVRAVCLTAAASGLVALGAGVARWGFDERPLWLLVAFAAGLVALEVFPVKLTHRGQSEALRLEEAFFVPMAFLLGPVETMAVIALALGIASVVSKRRALLKGLFNVGMITTSAGLGLAVAEAIGLDETLGARDVVAVVVGGLVFCAVSAVAVSGIIALSTATPMRPVLVDGFGVRVATWIGSLSLGVLVLLAAEQQPWALVAAAVPVMVLHSTFLRAMQQWRERQQAEALYAAAGRIRAGVDSAQVRAELVAAAADLLAAGEARVVHEPVGAEMDDGVLRVALDGHTAVEVAGRAAGGAWTRDDRSRLQALAGVASSALSTALLYEQLQAITRSLGEGVIALDAEGSITFINPAGAALLGWRVDDLLGQHIAVAVDPAGSRAETGGVVGWVHLPRLRAGETLRIEEYGVTRSDGGVLDVSLTASPVMRDGEVVGAVLALRDVTERKALQRRLSHQAFHDQLTGLPNRALFLDRLEHAQARDRDGDGGSALAVLFVDLDRFKTINDSLGHRAGDDVLCTVGSRLAGAVRAGDTVARFGGDEFTVLLEEVGDRREAVRTAERILMSLRQPVTAGDRAVLISASIGIAVSERGGGPADLLAAADIAMYEAKSTGSDRYAVAAADADGVARARLDLEMALRRGIERGELLLEYQPVVDAETEKLHGFEALVRWQHPVLGTLAPERFMGLAEESGLVLPLGDWVLEQACRAAKAWDEQHPGAGVTMAVNLSARQFQHPELCARVVQVLTDVGLDPGLLTLEITESVVMEDSPRTLDTLHALRDIGVRLAIDDFGTGYSSLSYLKRFPVDIVKIDKSFVDGVVAMPVDREIVAAVIRLADAVGMRTVAEGVETVEQLERLRRLGCSLVQGYLLAPPQPMDVLERRLGAAARAGLPVARIAGPLPRTHARTTTRPVRLPE